MTILNQKKTGFTLTELLVVISIFAVLASLLLPSLSIAQERARLASCMNNLRQIGVGFMMYLSDYDDTFPAANGSGHLVPEDWFYWQTVAQNDRKFDSPIANYVGGFTTNLFRCPGDRFLRKLDSGSHLLPATQRDLLFRFSYTLSTPLSAANNRRGMASTIVPGISPKYFRLYEVKNPTQKIMLAEEMTREEFSRRNLRGQLWDGDAGWNWHPGETDWITGRHSKKGSVILADGHVETVGTNYWQNIHHQDPSIY